MRRGRGSQGRGEEIGRGEVIPVVLSIPFLERLSLSQDSCCGHTTNLKAVLPLAACLSSPKLQLVPGSPPVRQGAREPAAPPASRPGFCGRSLCAPPGPPAAPPLRGAHAGAPGHHLTRPQPASSPSLPEGTSGKDRGREAFAAGKAAFGSPATPVGGSARDHGVKQG